MSSTKMPDIKDVRDYWEQNPLFSLEVRQPGSNEFFDALDKIKKEDVERFAMKYWQFEEFRGKKVLDVGCGPGWITVNYALAGAEVYAIDLTENAVELARRFLNYKHLSGRVERGNAEDLQFKDGYFDMIVSSGVLHHTPDFRRAFKECFRVLRPGGRAKITLYYKGILHNRFVFPLVLRIMKLTGMGRPGASLSEAKDADDFVRQYDGANNPLGIAKTAKDWIRELKDAGFEVETYELHFFPKRFVPFHNLVPDFVHRLLDKYFGTMIYLNLYKTKPV